MQVRIFSWGIFFFLAIAGALQPLMLPKSLPAANVVRIRKDLRLNEVLVVPSLRFIFCFIPKNAGTQFNRLMNALNGIERTGGVCSGADEPNYASAMHGNFTPELFERALNDPTWTKATFLRDPLERMVSAYLSKCVSPRECGGCMGLENMGLDKPDFNELARRVSWGSGNAHFVPQSSLCGGLADTIENYDYIGHISDDTKAVHAQVAEMLEFVLRRNSERPVLRSLLQNGSVTKISHDLARTYFQKNSNVSAQALDDGVQESSAAESASQSAALHAFGKAIGENAAKALRLGDKLFPENGLSAEDPHSHKQKLVKHSGRRLQWLAPWLAPWLRHKSQNRRVNSTEQASKLFRNMRTLMKALDTYAVDYDRLPGLRRPPWAARVAAYYDAASWLTRPSWLPKATSGESHRSHE